MTTQSVVLTKTMLDKAISAGTQFYDVTYAKDGLMARQQALDESALGASAIIVGLAKEARKADKSNTLAYFLAYCSAAEAVIKERGKSENVKDICPHWPVFKSNIKKAIKKGVDVAKHDTLNAITEARKELARAEAAPESSEQTEAVRKEDQPMNDVLKGLMEVYQSATEAERAVLLTDLQGILEHHKTAQSEQARDAKPMKAGKQKAA